MNVIRKFQEWLYHDLRLPYHVVYPLNHLQELWEFRNFKRGRIFHSCSLHPCEITKLNLHSDNVEGKSILDGSLQTCSLHSCGVYLMQQEEIDAYKNAWNKNKERGLLTIYYGSEEVADEFIKAWRTNEPGTPI